ncbi:peptidoglycan/LPS O-acetylase OafA/YrhL [Cupriavidus gilardii J11]|uniref:Peptidoglycan/LPS O-acetylase OafA/YrhL n=1 Tax=Cupriavidus gilardii J11 TaxID=936133 RepID=A0A562BIF8_9BURK|nr:acyltransferase family protein [Cupriavidus gilardii]TWG84988.1 peptidoglycan/LPS O-acetylase OafA/YrhL [Cupriavidus gilardii J11]
MTAPSRLAGIDALKAVGSQLIVLHHLAFYGPMSDIAHPLAPALIDWLCQYARIAVQVFLVVGGFLAARSLAPDGLLRTAAPWRALGRRYQKLAVPFAAAMVLSIGAAALARQWMVHESIPAPPTWPQVLAHLVLLHDVLGVDALSAGAWYVAIDLQLFALLLLLLWTARALPAGWRMPAGAALVGAMACASLWWFNRDAAWDAWACYFFGAYGMGVLAYWAAEPARARWALPALAAVAMSALAIDFRARIAVAATTALVLGLCRWRGWLDAWPRGSAIATLGRISYSVFLVHFPVCLLANALMSRLAPAEPGWHAVGMLAAWLASNVAGALFHRHVESADPFGALRRTLAARMRRVAG